MKKEIGSEDRHVLVIDDDPLFRAKVRAIAAKRGLMVTVCSSLRELDAMAAPHLFDIAIVDYYLDDLREYLRGTEIAAVMEDVPVVLVSSTAHGIADSHPWPDTVRKFITKSAGIDAILDAALAIAMPGADAQASPQCAQGG